MVKLIFRPPTELRGQVEDTELEVNPDILVEQVRLRVEKKLGVEEPLKLSCHGKTMDDEKPLRIYDVKEKDVITIQPKHFGTYLPKGVQPDKRKAEDDEEVMQVVENKKQKLMVDTSLLVEHAKISRDGLTIVAGTHGEQGRRRQMEDRHLICTSLRSVNSGVPEDRDFAVFAVLDGHGGNKTADFVRQALPAELAALVVKYADEPMADKQVRKIYVEAFARVDARIATELAGVVDGCCAIVLLNLGRQCWIANLGDSAGLLARSTGEPDSFKAIPLSNQHTCYVMKEKERIMRTGGAVDNGRINGILEVSRAFGDVHLKKFGVINTPDLMKVTLDPAQDRFIVLGCDGFFTSQPPAETVDIINEHLTGEEERAISEENEMSVSDTCKELCRYMLAEQKVQDNLTCMILVVKAD